MEIIQKLANCDLGREIYHSDGNGHVQVEYQIDSADPLDSPYRLLEQVEQEELWPEFFEMARTKDDEWIRGITRYFSTSEHYSTRCFVEFLSILSSRDAQIQLIQDSPNWRWDEKNISLINLILNKAKQLADSPPHDPLDREIELSRLNGAINMLELIRSG